MRRETWGVKREMITHHESRVTHHGSRITGHEPRITGHEPRITSHASQITHHGSRITGHASRVTHHESRFTLIMISIAISGGIDSLMAAFLLKEKGQQVFGIHFLTGYALEPPGQIEATGEQLGIPIKMADCRRAFQSKVVSYFTRTYQAGRTPNPCLVCNPAIKFGTVLAIARELGASCLGTGHYARISKDEQGRCHLLKGADPKKDQSYFLAFLSQEQLARACFPLGEMKKSEVKVLAQEKGLRPVVRESQDVCFVRGNYGEFLIRQGGFDPKPGPIEDEGGRLLGHHQGLHLFTIGQRRGIHCPAPEPYYVVRIDRERNRLVVGFRTALLSSECRVTGINWINAPATSPIQVQTRVRYRHQAAPSTLFPADDCTALIRFEEAQTAITPGQGAVFYNGDEVLGGGWIER